MECLNVETCTSERMRDMPQVGGLQAPGRFYGRAGCGAMVCPDGTYEEANAAVVTHRNEARAVAGLPPLDAASESEGNSA